MAIQAPQPKEVEAGPPEPTGQAPGVVAPLLTNPPERGRTAFRDIRRQLTDQELAQTGTQKIILEDFEKAEAECGTLREELDSYRNRWYMAELKVGVLTETVKTIRSIEIMFACGLALGGWAAGLAPYLWDRVKEDPKPGWTALLLGLILIIGASVGRLAKR